MPRRFSLATLLKLRRRQEDEAKAEFGRKVAETHQADEVMQQRYRDLTANLVPKDESPESFQAVAQARVSMRALYAEACAFKELKQVAQDEALHRWQETHQKTEAIDRLRQRHEETERRAERKAEQAEIDDIVNAKYSTDADNPHQEE